MVTFNEDSKAFISKEVKSINSSLYFLLEKVQKGEIDNELKDTLLENVELALANVMKEVAYNGDTTEKVNERYEETKRLVKIISELEAKLKSEDMTDKIKEQLTGLSESLDKWWKEYGFRYVEDIQFSDYGTMSAKLRFNFNNFSSIYSNKAVSKANKFEKWLNDLQVRGYKLIRNNDGKVVGLLDCDQNKKLLKELITSTFKSVKIKSIETGPSFEHDEFEIQSINITIKDLKELKAL